MSDQQFSNVSDVCSAMKQFAQQSSQPSARGSFTTIENLAQFSEAIAFLCDEITELRTELDEVKANAAREKAPERRRTPRASGRVAPGSTRRAK